VGVGLLCCIYLAALKLINVPCPLTGCGEIINSRFGSILGIPLPVFAIPFWIALAFSPNQAWQRMAQRWCVGVLVMGGLVLMCIQFFVLKGFCIFCTTHALAALLAAFALTKKGTAHPWLPGLVLALTLPLFIAIKAVAEARLRSGGTTFSESMGVAGPVSAPVPSNAALPVIIDKAAFGWLGQFDSKQSPILVVSFQCSHCLDLLGNALKDPRFGTQRGPKIFVYAQPQESADSIAVMAAMLSVPGTAEEQFAAVFSRLDALREPLLTHDSKELRNRLATLFPRYVEKLAAATQQFKVQVVALKYVPGKGSPYLLFPDGKSTYGVVSTDLFYH
jgi:uncharacterized membrane protein